MYASQQLLTNPLLLNKYHDLHQDEENYYFYKHFKFGSENYALDVFDNNALYFSSAFDYNDPYDCQFKVQFSQDFFNDDLVNSYFGMFQQFGEKILPTEIIKKFYLECHPEQFMINLKQNTQVTCFNNAPKSMLMWSHYGNNHKGYMVEFKIPKEHFLLPLPIQYSETLNEVELPLEFAVLKYHHPKCIDFYLKSFLTKAKDWEYEKEFRIVKQLIFPNGNEFPPEFISSVILGAQLRFDHENKIKTLYSKVQEYNKKHGLQVPVYLASLNPNKFEINVPDHPRLG